MKKTVDKKKLIKRIIIVCAILIVLVLLLLCIVLATRKQEEPKIVTQEEREETVVNLMRTKGEKERIQIYLAEYLKCIERKQYEKAYGKLAEQFKQNYFRTIQSYINYIEKYYSESMSVTYEDISRQGNYYILSVIVTNLEEIESSIEQKFIIYENALNDYVLSFQVKEEIS